MQPRYQKGKTDKQVLSLEHVGPGGCRSALTRIPKFLIFALQTHAEIGKSWEPCEVRDATSVE